MTKLTALTDQLTKAFARLREALDLPATQINRDATIQRFEFTFELAWKLLKTVAEEEGLMVNSPKEAIRTAAQLGLLTEVEEWFDFLEARNLSTHLYNEEAANNVYEIVKKFAPETERLMTKIKEKA